MTNGAVVRATCRYHSETISHVTYRHTGVVGGGERERVWKAERVKSDDVADGRQQRDVERRLGEPVVDAGRHELVAQRAVVAFVHESQPIRPLHPAAFAPVQIDLQCHRVIAVTSLQSNSYKRIAGLDSTRCSA